MPASRTLNNQRSSDTAPKRLGARSEPLQATSQALTRDGTPAQFTLAAAGAASPSDILALQRKVGNRAVQSLLARGAVQPKLHVGPAGDRYEQEADRVASAVLTMPAPPASQPPVQRAAEEDEDAGLQAKPLDATITTFLQRQPEEEDETVQAQPLVQRQAEEEDEVQAKPLVQRQPEEEDEVQAKPLAAAITPHVQRQEEEEEVQTKAIDFRAGFAAGSSIEGQRRSEKGRGSPLPADVRSYMEPRFGLDFGDVRVHADRQADRLNRQRRAQAFTHGTDIYLGEGQYAPGTDGGKRLLAHELTHVVQQGAARTAGQPGEGVQRAFGILGAIGNWFKNIKKSKLAKKYTALKSHIAEEEKQPTKADQQFKVSIAMVTGSVVRSRGSLTEAGHAWVELETLKPWAEIEKGKVGQALRNARPRTAQMLENSGWSSFGFYPAYAANDKKAASRAQTLQSVPGGVVEPERSYRLAFTKARKSFPAAAEQAAKFVSYVKDHECASYNLASFNCTTFAVGAVGAAGFQTSESIGAVTTKKIVAPNKVYKRLFERAVLGDKSVTILKELQQRKSKKGKKGEPVTDTAHIEDPEAEALASVQGGDLLAGTENIYSPAFNKVNKVLYQYEDPPQPVSFDELLKANEIDLQTYQALSPVELKMLRTIYQSILKPDPAPAVQPGYYRLGGQGHFTIVKKDANEFLQLLPGGAIVEFVAVDPDNDDLAEIRFAAQGQPLEGRMVKALLEQAQPATKEDMEQALVPPAPSIAAGFYRLSGQEHFNIMKKDANELLQVLDGGAIVEVVGGDPNNEDFGVIRFADKGQQLEGRMVKALLAQAQPATKKDMEQALAPSAPSVAAGFYRLGGDQPQFNIIKQDANEILLALDSGTLIEVLGDDPGNELFVEIRFGATGQAQEARLPKAYRAQAQPVARDRAEKELNPTPQPEGQAHRPEEGATEGGYKTLTAFRGLEIHVLDDPTKIFARDSYPPAGGKPGYSEFDHGDFGWMVAPTQELLEFIRQPKPGKRVPPPVPSKQGRPSTKKKVPPPIPSRQGRPKQH